MDNGIEVLFELFDGVVMGDVVVGIDFGFGVVVVSNMFIGVGYVVVEVYVVDIDIGVVFDVEIDVFGNIEVEVVGFGEVVFV